MGAILGLTAGLGLAMIVGVLTGAFPERRRIHLPVKPLAHAVFAAMGAGAAALLAVGNLGLALAAAVAGAWLPAACDKRRIRRRLEQARLAWPDALDGVVSGLRAGLGVGESLAGLQTHGPAAMRASFARFSRKLEATGRLDVALDGLKSEMADPVADRVVEAMRLASRVGGHDLAAMMEALSHSLRMENRARGELLARQSWTVNGARIAAAAPWIVVALLATRPSAVKAFSTAAGTLVLLGGFAATVVAYLLMVRLGRLPAEPRVLAGPEVSAGPDTSAGSQAGAGAQEAVSQAPGRSHVSASGRAPIGSRQLGGFRAFGGGLR